jgi:alpha-glucosidase (family GH31 glycosyl hydrolase)
MSPVNNPSGESTKHTAASPGSVPLYAIHNGECFLTLPLGCYFSLLFSAALGDLSLQTIPTNATHHGGYTELDMHNLFGHLMSRAANLALRQLHPEKRPFIITRSSFAGSGTWTGHWVRVIFA